MSEKRRERQYVGIGRPPKPIEKRQRNRLMVTLTDEEWEALLKAAGEERPATYVRGIVLRHLARVRR